MISLFGITLAQPGALWLAPIFLAAIALIWWACIKRRRSIAHLAHPKWRSLLILHYVPWLHWAKAVLKTLAFLGLFIALLRPQWGFKKETVKQEGRDVLIALDISRSMLAQDSKPDRLSFAKEKIQALLQRLASERVGLILFSGAALVQCPLTSDFAAFSMFLNHVDAETISSGSTMIALAIKKALELFSRAPEQKSKLLLIVTDGEDFSQNLTAIRRQAQEMGLHIITLGVGTPEGAPIPLFDQRGIAQGHQKDEHGAIVISQLNEEILQATADSVGGLYVRAENGTHDIDTIVKFVQKFEKDALQDQRFSHAQERFYYFVAMSLFCFLLDWIL